MTILSDCRARQCLDQGRNGESPDRSCGNRWRRACTGRWPERLGRCRRGLPLTLASPKVLTAESAELAHGLAEPLAALIVSLAAPYDTIIAPSTSSGKNVCPRVAALLDVMQISDITKVISADTFERPIYAGNAIQTVKSKDAKKVITVRTAAFGAAETGGSAVIEAVAVPSGASISTYQGEELSKSDRPELTSAKIIISGGRAMQSRENFTTYIEPVADKLGAAMGASRAGSRCRLRAERLAGRPDRQGRGAGSLCCRWYLGRDPASRRDEG